MYKRNSKILAALLTIVLVFSIFPSLRVNAADVTSGECGAQGDNLTWTFDDTTGTLTISGTGDMADYEVSSPLSITNNPLPWEHLNYYITTIVIEDGVTSIGDYAFFDCFNAQSVTIPAGVISIGEHAFYLCYSLNNVELPSSVTTLGDFSFGGCKTLSNITINGTISYIGKNAFFYTAIFDIPRGLNLTDIPEGLFDNCVNLTSVTIPNSVTSIGNSVFENCTNITSVYIPSSVTTIGSDTFYNCRNLTTINIPDSVTSIGDRTFGLCTSLKNISIPDSVTSIGDGTFEYCTSLKSISIPNSITLIGAEAFRSCEELTSITIPVGVASIGEEAFRECISLTSVIMDKELYVSTDISKVFVNCHSNLEFRYFTYDINYVDDGNGTVSGLDKSASTDTIDLIVTPDANYVVDKVTVTDSTDTTTITPDANGNYTFIMPSEEVKISATFILDQKSVTFKNEDGTVLQSGAVDCGTNPTYTGSTPAKAETDKYTYTFAGWSDGTKTYGPTDTLPVVTDDATYTAVFDSTVKQYTIKFVDEDGTVLQSGDFNYGTTPSYTGSTPTKAEDDDYTYAFAGWTPAIVSVTGNTTYTATFTATAKPAPVSKPGTYYLSSMVEQDGKLVITIKMNEDDSKTFDLWGSISSDGVLLTEGKEYARAKGSLIITLQKSFLDTLAAGNHKLTVTFTDGGSITIDYVVKAPATASVPATGEAISTASVLGCIILATAGIAFTVSRKRKEEI